jgi:hypothetical protein
MTAAEVRQIAASRPLAACQDERAKAAATKS